MPQTPPTQFAVPLTSGQILVQLPQLSTLFDVSTSQPLDASVSQSRKLPVHVMEHAPSAHVAVPWFVEHGVPQAPQFLTLVFVFVSHPFESMPSQSANPGLQLCTMQTPPSQAAVAFVRAQGRLHPPQLSGSESVLISQPSPGIALQLADGAIQAPRRHPLLLQVESAFGNEHTLPHAPQFDGSVRVFTSQPVDMSLSQLEKPALHWMISQALSTHCWFAFRRLQANPQVPQFLGSRLLVVRFASQAFVRSPSQLANPVLHGPTTHSPPRQSGAAFRGGWHSFAQAPQLAGSSSRFVSQPSRALPLQSPRP